MTFVSKRSGSSPSRSVGPQWPDSVLQSLHGLGTYQHINSTAHAVLLALVMHDGSVVQQILQKAADQKREDFPRAGEILMLPAMF